MADDDTSRADRPSTTHLPPLDKPPTRVLDWLVKRFPRVGEAAWRSRFERGLVQRADGTALGVDAPYECHLQIRYFREVDDEPSIPIEEHVVFEDEHLVVADKPPFLPVIPGGPFVRECLLERLRRRLGEPDLAPLHRLDRATSGLVVFSRQPPERGVYGALFAERRIEKIYEALAVLDAEPTVRRRTVESRIVPGEPFFRMRQADGEPDGGPPNSRTEIELLEAWQDGERRLGRFRLRPISGRKHQLRLHMASLGMPIVGDRVYPELLPEAADDFRDPLRLVARELRFDDPVTAEARRFVSAYDVTSLSSLPSAGSSSAATARVPSSSTRTTRSVRSSS